MEMHKHYINKMYPRFLSRILSNFEERRSNYKNYRVSKVIIISDKIIQALIKAW